MPRFLNNSGFTIPELIISMSIVLTIFAFAGVNLLNIIPEADITRASDSFMADAKAQQNAAMLGESAVASHTPYSIRIDASSYTLYKGQVFSPTDPANYKVDFPENVSVTTNFADSKITFAVISGEIEDFNSSNNQVVFQGVNGRSLIIKFNRLGNVYYVSKI